MANNPPPVPPTRPGEFYTDTVLMMTDNPFRKTNRDLRETLFLALREDGSFELREG